jgi:hypothetical protein
MIRAAIILIIEGKKTRKLERINRRRNAENLPNLPEIIYFGNDNLMIFVELIIRFYRFHPLFAVKPRNYTVGRKDVYPEISLSIIISVKISILIFQIFIQYRYRQRLILISEYRSLIFFILKRLSRTPFIFYIFD